jgi:excisionase family DNA binding protein
MTTRTEQRRDIERARAARGAAGDLDRYLAGFTANDDEVKMVLPDGGPMMVVPRRALELLVEILEAFGDGQDPSVLPMAKELSSGELAGLLGVSRQYAVRLLDDGRIPYRRVGNRRRVLVGDALRYLRDDNRRRVERFRDQAG